MPILTRAQPNTSPPLPPTAPPADILNRAASLIEANGRHIGSVWEFADRIQWQPGMACCVVGSIAIAIGITRRGYDAEMAVIPAAWLDDDNALPHPAFAALMAHLGMATMNAVFAWSDQHEAGQIAAAMRACASQLRADVAA